MTDSFKILRKKIRQEQTKANDFILWEELAGAIEPFYSESKEAGYRPIDIERMQRIYFLQHWSNWPIFWLVNKYIQENGIKLYRGTVVEASTVSTPSSTKNIEKKCYLEIHQIRMKNQWYFGIKAYAGLDSRIKMNHSMVNANNNIPDSALLSNLLCENKTRAQNDPTYTRKDFIQGKRNQYGELTDYKQIRNVNKPRIRAKLQYLFGIVRDRSTFTKARYRVLDKETHPIYLFPSRTYRR